MNENNAHEQMIHYFEGWCGEFEKYAVQLVAKQQLVRYMLEVHSSFYAEGGASDDRLEALLDRVNKIQITIKGE